jgi:hypothetical protein
VIFGVERYGTHAYCARIVVCESTVEISRCVKVVLLIFGFRNKIICSSGFLHLQG